MLNKTLRLFLDSIGRREEYEFYLKKFSTDKSAAFAILCPERPDFEEVAPVFNFDLSFLLQLELNPVILLCGPEAPVMRRILFQGEHVLEALELNPQATTESRVANVLVFLETCRQSGKIGVLVAPHMAQTAVLLELIPPIARRVHFIRLRGHLRNAQDEKLLFYNVNRPDSAGLDDEDQPLAAMASALLEQRPATHISVASPWNLLQELFTVKGAGCVIRRGLTVCRAAQLTSAQEAKLVHLLEESFGKQLRDRTSMRNADEFYFEENFRGVAVLLRQEAGMYLSKFAVNTQARGEGLAQDLWREITSDHPRMFWRARTDNPINHWYEKQADGYHKEGKWKVFWRGIPADRLTEIVRYSLNCPEDFV